MPTSLAEPQTGPASAQGDLLLRNVGDSSVSVHLQLQPNRISQAVRASLPQLQRTSEETHILRLVLQHQDFQEGKEGHPVQKGKVHQPPNHQ